MTNIAAPPGDFRVKYSDAEERDEAGRWTSGGSSGVGTQRQALRAIADKYEGPVNVEDLGSLVDPTMTKEALDTLDGLVKQYPKVLVDLSTGFEDDGTLASTVPIAEGAVIRNRINLADSAFSDPHLKDDYKASEAEGYHPPISADPVTCIMTHEFGHALANTLGQKTEQKITFGAVQPFGPLGTAASMQALNDNISAYATTGYQEATAEAFAEYKLMGDKARPMAKVIGAALDKAYQKKFGGDVVKYSDSQPRDDHGRWTSGGGEDPLGPAGPPATGHGEMPAAGSPTGGHGSQTFATSQLGTPYHPMTGSFTPTPAEDAERTPGIPFPYKLDGLDAPDRGDVLTTLRRLSDSYPEAAKEITWVHTGQSAGDIAAYNEGSRDIVINPKLYPPKPEPGWAIAEDGPGTLIHEFGHAVHQVLRATDPGAFDATGQLKVTDEYLVKAKAAEPGVSRTEIISQGLSLYAAIDPYEFFSEAFTEHMVHPDTERPLAKLVGGVVDRALLSHHLVKYSDAEERDGHGRWTAGGEEMTVEDKLRIGRNVPAAAVARMEANKPFVDGAQKTWAGRLVPDEGAPNHYTHVGGPLFEPDDMDPKLTKQVSRAMDGLTMEYPKARLIWVKNDDVLISDKTRVMAQVGSKPSNSSSAMYTNPRFFKSEKTLVKNWDESVASGWHPRIDASPVEAVITHEFGHVLVNSLGVTGEKQLLRAVNASLPADPYERRDAITHGLSKYAATRGSELLAEGFAEYKLNGDSARPLAKAIGEAVDHAYRNHYETEEKFSLAFITKAKKWPGWERDLHIAEVHQSPVLVWLQTSFGGNDPVDLVHAYQRRFAAKAALSGFTDIRPVSVNPDRAKAAEDDALDWLRNLGVGADQGRGEEALGALYRDAYGAGRDVAQEVVHRLPNWRPTSELAGIDQGRGLVDLLHQSGVWIKGMDDETVARIGATIAAGVNDGQPADRIANKLRAIVDDPDRALLISRTETARAMGIATLDTYQETGVGTVTWLASDDGYVCPECQGNEDQGPVETGDAFESGDIYPPAHPQCFPGWVSVVVPRDVEGGLSFDESSSRGALQVGPLTTSAVAQAERDRGGIRAGVSREYVGDLITIQLASGNELTGTPNHPIATRSGWVPLAELRVGDDVLCCSFGEGRPDVDDVPATIQEVVESLPVVLRGMPTASEDFHGDGAGSQVHVIRTNGVLMDDREPMIPERVGHRQFSVRDVAGDPVLEPLGPEFQFIRRSTASGGDVGGSGESPTFLGRGVAHAHEHRLASASWHDAIVEQAPSDAISVDTEEPGEGQFAFAGLITTDEILNINRDPFSGHVFNLETMTGWYTANTVIVHNCRCALTPWSEVANVAAAADPDLTKATPKAAGLAVRAADTGRLLMIQRGQEEGDPASGRFEFPGGHSEDGETPLDAARREWSEEIGDRCPAVIPSASWASPDGVYRGFVVDVPSEDDVDINLDYPRVQNPDAPVHAKPETALWIDPDHLEGMPLRDELARDLSIVHDALGGGTAKGADVSDEARDDHGRWTAGGSDSASDAGVVDEQGRLQGGAKRAADIIAESPDGFTVHPYRGSVPRTGYQVGGLSDAIRLPAEKIQDRQALAQSLVKLREDNAHLFTKGGRVYLGGWVNEGTLWLEPSERIQNLEQAKQLGTERNQISIWDNARGREVQIGGTGDLPKGASGVPRGLGRDVGAGEGGGRPGHGGRTQRPTGSVVKAGDVSDEARDDHGRWTAGGGDFLKNAYWHGSPNGEPGMKVAAYGVHVGTYQAAKEALEARIGRRADGKDWDGTQEYGKTLLQSGKTGSMSLIPELREPHYPKPATYREPVLVPGEGWTHGPSVSWEQRDPNKRYNSVGAVYSDMSPVPMDAKPDLFPVHLVGPMTNTLQTPHEDFKANGYMAAALKRGNAKRGYYYSEVGEDAGSIAAVVPSRAHLQTYDEWVAQRGADKAASDDEARDDHGRWTGGGGSGAASEPRQRFFHGSDHEFEPGEDLLSPRSRNAVEESLASDPGQVYLSNSRSFAKGFGRYVYEVKPHGEPIDIGYVGGRNGEVRAYSVGSATIVRRMNKAASDDEARDDHGRWTAGGGSDAADTSYRGGHQAPNGRYYGTPDQSDVPLHELDQLVPADIYDTKVQRQYYGSGGADPDGNKSEIESFKVINSVRGKPDTPVKIYRAVPADAADNEIHPGDWVTPSQHYAKWHGESNLNGQYRILSKTVPARQLWWDANSVNEFGWDPSEGKADKAADHDVTDEARDQHGEWTAGGGDMISPHDQAPEAAHGKAAARPDNPRATQFSSLSPPLKAKIDTVLKAQGLDRGSLSKNLETVWDRMTKESPEILEEGKHWYEDAHHAIADKLAESGSDLTPKQAVAVTAALSPQNEWGQNIAGAGFLMKTIGENPAITLSTVEKAYLKDKAKGPRPSARAAGALLAAKPGIHFNDLPSNQAAWATILLSKRVGLRSDAETSTGKKPLVTWSCGTLMIGRAIDLARGGEPADVLAGHKVRSFFNNLADPKNSQGRGDVTVDTHAINASALMRMASKTPQLKALISTPDKRDENVKGAYSAFADAFRTVAANHGVNPNQAQAALWLMWQKVRMDYPSNQVESQAERNRKTGRWGVQHADTDELGA